MQMYPIPNRYQGMTPGERATAEAQEQNAIDVTAGDVATTLARLVIDMADEHELLLKEGSEETLAVEFADVGRITRDGNVARFVITLENGRRYGVIIDELGE